MYKAINGWTKETMKQAVKDGNNGAKSFENGHCVYKSSNDNKCAIGCFIPEDRYESFFDLYGVSVTDIAAKVPNMPLDIDGLELMQGIHDNNFGEEDIRNVLCDWIDKNVG